MLATLRRFGGFLVPYRGRLAGGAFFTLASSALVLAQPWPLKVIVDNVLREQPLDLPLVGDLSQTALLNAAVAALLAIVLLNALFTYLGSFLMDSSGIRMVADLRETLFARLQRQSLRFHAGQRTGDLISRVMSDITRIQDMLIQSFSVLVPNVTVLIGMMIVMFWIDWAFTLVALAVGPPLFGVVLWFKGRIKTASRRARALEGELAAQTGETLGAIRVVQAFTREDFEDERFSRQATSTLDANLEARRLQARFTPLIDVLAGVGTAVVLLFGAHQVLGGELSLGLLLVFLSYVGSLYKPMRQLSKLTYVTARATASAERVSELLDAVPDVRDEPGAVPAPRLRGRVQVEDAQFAYIEGQPVLHDVSIDVAP